MGTRDVRDTTLVQPGLVAEIRADTSVDRGGVYRHPNRTYACACTPLSMMCPAWARARGTPQGDFRCQVS
ncbi:hypothetical protein [Streptomyces virginiae]|uniref:hypothetical protein n=1 Tax=Streptomyces virginiae TaxID=1961 RepID=UPI0036F91A56